ncbi:uncharacterized protein EI90DRAFT_3048242 [Cantharellus anzutake]|uniref:uncharacterized protein n=1 Tax=Cantharellus anzutake TaxID=1750568 RepID=UPI00190461B6|nr:uncharacterized protein EI90DRAFT_3048242 [Cantharellus anzutake]KAF8335404.1 hypothetical protein EI90DRAFT_3048242 [Cantharellus anzutake]
MTMTAAHIALCIVGLAILTCVSGTPAALLWTIISSPNHRPALRGYLIFAILFMLLHVVQIVSGELLITKHLWTYNSVNEMAATTLRSCTLLASAPTISGFHLFLSSRALRSICTCFSCRRLTHPVVLFCLVVTIFLCAAESALSIYGVILAEQGP